MIECTTINKDSTLEINMDELLKSLERFGEVVYEATTIFVGNPLDLIEIDFCKIPSNCYFISNRNIAKGEMYKVDGDLKRTLYEFIKEYPNRVFRGKKFSDGE